jgi:fibro-slime domain-containing protein
MSIELRSLAVLLAVALLPGCGARSELPDRALAGGGTGDAGPVCASAGVAVLTGRIRDFSTSHPDFEKFIDDDPGIVAPDLGADGAPVYGDHATTLTTTGKADFDQWYHDVPGVNLGADWTLPLSGDLGAFSFDSEDFFPIDGQLLGDEGMAHNFSFTLALHGQFRYQGGEAFSVTGDDDLWIFVNGRLAVDLGGVHDSESGGVDVDTLAASLGLVQNGVYPLDVFFAERHTAGSTLHVSLAGPDLCVIAP